MLGKELDRLEAENAKLKRQLLIYLQKQTPQKIIRKDHKEKVHRAYLGKGEDTYETFMYRHCLNCNGYLGSKSFYCPNCGQKLDWSN